MAEWHEIIQLDEMDDLLLPRNYEVVVAVLSFAVGRLKQTSCAGNIDIEVIAFGISALNPAIGIHIRDDQQLRNREDIRESTTYELSTIIQKARLVDVIASLASDKSGESKTWTELNRSKT